MAPMRVYAHAAAGAFGIVYQIALTVAASPQVILPNAVTLFRCVVTAFLPSWERKLANAVQSTPMISRTGALVGMLSTHFSEPHRPSERDLRLIDLMARQAADLIEKFKADEELWVSNEALRRANDDLKHFAYAASHDLQQPLRMITSYSQLLVKGYRGQLDGEAGVCINFISSGTRHMRELLADLLAYTQVEAEDQPPDAAVDLQVVFQNVTEHLRTAIEENDAMITSDRLPVVHGHDVHFLQLFRRISDHESAGLPQCRCRQPTGARLCLPSLLKRGPRGVAGCGT
jgi:signal transduction histidine kinase